MFILLNGRSINVRRFMGTVETTDGEVLDLATGLLVAPTAPPPVAVVTPPPAAVAAPVNVETPPKKRRGRPKKNAAPVETPPPDAAAPATTPPETTEEIKSDAKWHREPLENCVAVAEYKVSDTETIMAVIYKEGITKMGPRKGKPWFKMMYLDDTVSHAYHRNIWEGGRFPRGFFWGDASAIIKRIEMKEVLAS